MRWNRDAKQCSTRWRYLHETPVSVENFGKDRCFLICVPSVLERLDAQLRRLEIDKSVLIRMTGCPNGCARPYMAELALVGSGVNQYQLWLGGSANLQRLAQPFLQRMPLEELEQTIEPLLISWKQAGGRRSLGDHVEKLGDQAVSELLGAAA